MKKAFTLAETLIVIGIIGIVAALTMTSLNKSISEKEVVAKLTKTYATLENAFTNMLIDYGSYEKMFQGAADDTERQTIFKTAILKYLKTSKSPSACADITKCVGNIAGDTSIWFGVVLSDGTGVAFRTFITGTDFNGDTENRPYGNIIVDVDGGEKGFNKASYDNFFFFITEKGLYPAGLQGASGYTFESDCPSTQGCTAWVLENKNMDYLKCRDILGWDAPKKRSCK